MCGIAGIIDFSTSLDLRKRGVSMSDKISHRGPDGSGLDVWNNVLLVHRRLAIIDLSEHALQPMHYSERYSVIFNGEIYNYLELKEELVKLGHSFTTSSDTEVLLQSWAEWGPACQEKFNGMWAFALLDRQERKVWLSRDRFGVKPLYYRATATEFAFASEIGPLLVGDTKPTPNLQLVADFLIDGFSDHTDQTFFEGIWQLTPSSYIELDLVTKKFNKQRYYQPKRSADSDLFSLMEKSIALRMRSDVTVGTCLSGGIDSSLIATMAAATTKEDQPLLAIHATTGMAGSDESNYAKLVADNANIKLTTICPKVSDYSQAIEEVIKTQQEPFGSPSIIMQYFVMKEAHKIGCKVMLDGQAADEVFLGYRSYIAPIAFAELRSGRLSSFLKLAFKNPRTIIAFAFKKLFGSHSPIKTRFSRKSYRPKVHSSVFSFQKDEIYSRHLPALLRYEDRNSMKHGVEARLPFMDYRVVELGMSLSADLKIKGHWQKHVLRKTAEKMIPSEICWRKDKLGFVSPLAPILKDIEQSTKEMIQRSDIIQKNFTHPDLSELSNDKLWRLYCVAHWEKIFFGS